MINPAQIPDEVVDKFYMDGLWMGTPDEARAAIAAAINAWTGASMKTTFWPNDEGVWIVPRHGWLLPLPQEARDD